MKTRHYMTLIMLLSTFTLAAQWQPTNGPEGGDVNCIASYGAYVFAGTGGGIYRSEDNGANWVQAGTELAIEVITALKNNGGILYAGTENGSVYTSIDNGNTWTNITNNLGLSGTVLCFALPATSTIIIGSYNGAYVSTNNGTSWSAANNGLNSNSVYDLAVLGTFTIAATGDGTYVSTDNALSWTKMAGGMTQKYIQAVHCRGTNLYATYSGGIYISYDTAKTWQARTVPQEPGSTGKSIYVYGNDIFVLYFGGLYRSTNNGATFMPADTGLPTNAYYSLHGIANNLFVGTYGGGIYYSSNNGKFNAVNKGLHASHVKSILKAGNKIMAGTYGTGAFVSAGIQFNWTAMNTNLTFKELVSITGNGTEMYTGTIYNIIYRSGDNGKTWAQATTGLPTTGYLNNVYTIGERAYAACTEGGYMTTNHGTSWSKMTSLPDTVVTDFLFTGNKLYAATFKGVYVSSDSGTTWTAPGTGLTRKIIYSIAGFGTDVYAGTDSAGVFHTSDGGATWTLKSTGLQNLPIIALGVKGTRLFASYEVGGTMTSDNGGASWTNASNGLHLQASGYRFTFIDTMVIQATHDGLFLTTDNGQNWTNFTTALVTPTRSILHHNGKLYVTCYNAGVFVSDVKSGWTPSSAGMTNFYTGNIISNGTHLWASASYLLKDGVYKSTDMGASWTAVKSGITNLDIRSVSIANSVLYAGTASFNSNAFRSVDGGANWLPVTGAPTDKFILSVVHNGTRLFMATQGAGVYVSSDNGLTWSASNSGLANLNVVSVAVNGTDVYACTWDGLFKSTDNGSSWTQLSPTGLGTKNIECIIFTGGNMIVGTMFNGVLVSKDNGSTWKSVNTGFPSSSMLISSLFIDGQMVYAGTRRNGVWKRTITDLTGIKEEKQATKIGLYPNPSNGMVTVELGDFSRQQNVTITVTDISGKNVYSRQLANTPGTLQLDLGHLGNGIYIVQAASSNSTAASRLVISR